MSKISKESLLQIFIITVCLFILTFQFTGEAIQAQTACDGQPPNHPNPAREAWIQGTIVSVVVFDHVDQSESDNQRDFQIINEGIQSWNPFKITNCSNVTFNEAIRADRPYIEGEPIPDNTMFVARLYNSQLDPFYRNFGSASQSIRAARVRLQYPFRSSTPGGFKRLTAHETGHSFGVRNETPVIVGRSMMGHSNTITECDTEAIKRTYCPMQTPTPTPTPTPNPCTQCSCCDCDSGCGPCSHPDPGHCPEAYIWDACGFCTRDISPIVIDVLGNGYNNVSSG